ncbi:MAG: hypothetical protein WCK58_18225 [Chloroflexota bacterium]
MGVTVVRGLVGGFGVVLVLISILMVGVGGPGADLFSAAFVFVPGVVIVAGVLLERTRYRSLAAERSGHTHGRGGGETAHPDPRFQPTGERFLDPTTRVPMCVWLDPATGERLYVPEA